MLKVIDHKNNARRRAPGRYKIGQFCTEYGRVKKNILQVRKELVLFKLFNLNYLAYH